MMPQPGKAHEVLMYASAAGKTIKGSVYFSGGAEVQNATIRVLGPDGEQLGETTTNREGDFTFEAEVRADHVFVATTPGGHRATYTVEASELPSSLPLPERSQGPGGENDGGAGANQKQQEEGRRSRADSGTVRLTREEVRSIVEEAVARQVGPLRRELQKYRNAVHFTDVLGGIGYILGVMGIILYLKK